MSNDARRQKKLAKHKAKRKEKRSHMVRQSSGGVALRFASAASWPIVDVLIGEGLWQSGLAMAILTRRMPNGAIALASFIIDIYCLGVKDADANILSSFEYSDFLSRSNRASRFERVTPEYLAKLIREAIAFAREFGFAPHADFRAASLLLAGIDPAACTEAFTFGKDGKPFYIQGPNESFARANSIARQVENAGGHYLLGGPMGAWIDEDESDEEFDEEE